MMDRVNAEKLIDLVEKRPVIWDKTISIYKDKDLKSDAWKEICIAMKPNFLEMEPRERREFGKLVLKKWTHIRDSWMRSIKKQCEYKSSGAFNTKLYVYHNQLRFMNKITKYGRESGDEIKVEPFELIVEDAADIDEGDSGEQSEISASTSFSSSMPKKRKENTDAYVVDNNTAKFMEVQMNAQAQHAQPQPQYQESHHLSFFKGILPSVATLTLEQTLEFQAGVIHLLQKIRRKTPEVVGNPSTSSLQTQSEGYQWFQPCSTNYSSPKEQVIVSTFENPNSPTETMSNTSSHHSDFS